MYIAIQLLAGLVASTDPTAVSLPDACDQVRTDKDVRKYCNPHGEGAPIWDASICCDDAACHMPTPYGCATSEIEYHCDYGERRGEDLVQCFYLVPNYCDVFECPSPAEIPSYKFEGDSQGDMICCSYGICIPYNSDDPEDCYEGAFNCTNLYSNDDGTVGCADDE